MTPFCLHEYQIRRLMKTPNLKYLPKSEYSLGILYVISDWTKPLRGSVSPDLIYNV